MTTALSNSSYNNNHSAGFTLIELMVTIAVLAIIVSIAAPNVSTQLANQRVKATTATLVSALKEAKAESVIRRQDVTLTYNSTSTPKTITLTANGTELSKFNIAGQSTVTITPTTATSVIFQSNKTISGSSSVVYTICDSNNKATPRQVAVSAIASISNKSGGTC